MTTFLDFRYARSLSGALFSSGEAEETSLTLEGGRDNYLALDLPAKISPGRLLTLTVTEAGNVISVDIDASGSLSLCRGGDAPLVRTPPGSLAGLEGKPFSLRLGPSRAGFKLNGHTYEQDIPALPDDASQFTIERCTTKILGQGTGRAQRWARLHYQRGRRAGLPVRLVIDWHNLRAGIPVFTTYMAEQFIEHTDFQLQFTSYALHESEAAASDFPRLFSSNVTPEVTLHFSPPMYTRRQPNSMNIGVFVVEAMNALPGVVRRANMMDAIFVPSNFVAKGFRDSGVRCPIRVIPHGVDTEFFQPASPRTRLAGGRSFNFLAISTSVERKNVRYIVQAFLEEFREHEDVSLFLFTRPEYFATQNNVALEFEAVERRYARDSAPVFLSTSYVSLESLRKLYANADVYVMPSNEGFGLTLIEAMACGTPAIGLQHGAVVDFVNEDNGFLVPTGRQYVSTDMTTLATVGDRLYAPDIGKLRAAMRYAFERPEETRRRGNRARQDCEERYTWSRVAAEMAVAVRDVYQQCSQSQSAAVEESRLNGDTLSWTLCCTDDSEVSGAVADLANLAHEGNDVLCLFTRYSRSSDVLRARKQGFLFYAWDGTMANCRSVADRIVLTPWVGVLHSDEKIEGDVDELVRFLTALPPAVSEISVVCPDGAEEVRFFRPSASDGNTRQQRYSGLSIRRR